MPITKSTPTPLPADTKCRLCELHPGVHLHRGTILLCDLCNSQIKFGKALKKNAAKGRPSAAQIWSEVAVMRECEVKYWLEEQAAAQEELEEGAKLEESLRHHIPGVSAPGQTPPPTVETGPATTTPVGGVDNKEKTLEAARLLCANLRNGGTGHMTLVDRFEEIDNA